MDFHGIAWIKKIKQGAFVIRRFRRFPPMKGCIERQEDSPQSTGRWGKAS
jgi:hypothetical protein